jgi:hypothetical protein
LANGLYADPHEELAQKIYCIAADGPGTPAKW